MSRTRRRIYHEGITLVAPWVEREGVPRRLRKTPYAFFAGNDIVFRGNDFLYWGCRNREYRPTDFVAEPRFADPDNGDFRLQPGSPGIDAGMTLDHIATDLRGVARPQGAGFDIGAHELEQPPSTP